ncbi:MAG: F0F1 ATP synthase subunit epsilon [bacterium]|jgi:F-type H+-transporting ATPase subunit epsilon
MSIGRNFKVEILEPDGKYVELAPGDRFSGLATDLVFPALDGFAGIKPGHAQMLAGVGIGDLMIIEDRAEGGPRVLHFAISGGLLEVADGGDVTVYADSIEYAGAIDCERARESEERARKRLESKESGTDEERARAALLRALNREEIAKKYGRR